MTTIELRIAAMVGIVLVMVIAAAVTVGTALALRAIRAAWRRRGAATVPPPRAALPVERVARSRQFVGRARC